MSAPDAAPLPRQGEVFFDVRGEARVLRLSWYADTGIAVFSIWQGGTCTGTFRLPMDELPRMVETLRRGPGGPAAADPGPPTQAAVPLRPDRYAEAGYRPARAEAPPRGEVAARAGVPEPPEEQTMLAEGGFSYGSRKTYVSQQAARYDDPAGYDEYGGYAGPPRGPLPVGRWHDDQEEHYPPGAGRVPAGDRYGPDQEDHYAPGAGRVPAGDRYGPDQEDHYLPGEADPLADYGPERGYQAGPGEAGPLAGYAPERDYQAPELGAGRPDDEYDGYGAGHGHGGFGPEPDDEYGPDHGYPAHPEPLDHGYGPDDGYDAGHHGSRFEPDPLSDDPEAEEGYLPGPMTGTFGALEGGYDLETVGPGYHAEPGYRDEREGYDPGPPPAYHPARGGAPSRGEATARDEADDQPPPAGYRSARGGAGEDPLEREYRPSRGRS